MNLKSILIVCALGVVASSQAVVVTQWNFNSPTPDAATGTGTLAPSTGSGSLVAVGGVTTTFGSGDANGGSTDPAIGDDSGLQTTGYAAQGQSSGAAGIRFNVSTVGFTNVSLNFDVRHSNTSSRYVGLFYTTDGTNFISKGVFDGPMGDTWFNNQVSDFTGVAGVSNNALFAVRLAPVFAPGTTAYAASNPTGTYAPAGTLRYDQVTINAQPVPEPASMVALGLGAAAMIRRRRKA